MFQHVTWVTSQLIPGDRSGGSGVGGGVVGVVGGGGGGGGADRMSNMSNLPLSAQRNSEKLNPCWLFM